MVPAQIRAITHLHLADNHFFRMAKSAASKLKGLEHVEVEFVLRMPANQPFNRTLEMETFKKNGGVEWLKSIGLKSIHFTTFIADDTSVVDDEDLDFLETSIREWKEREEAEIMGC
jgi:hypothetical protein